MKKIIVNCKKCKTQLSETVSEIEQNSLRFIEGEDILPENSFIIHKNLIPNNKLENTILYVSSDAIMTENNIHADACTGCCGIYEFDYLNQICSNCREEVGAEITECYMNHFMVFDVKKVFIQEL